MHKLHKRGRWLSPLAEAAEIACRISAQLFPDHYFRLNSSPVEAGAREVRIRELIKVLRNGRHVGQRAI